MRRPGWMLAGAVVLSLLPVTVSGCSVTCGCTSTADPNWTPQPYTATAQEAAIYAAKMARFVANTTDAPEMTAVPVSGPNGRTFYEATAADTIALVAAADGVVVEVVLEDRAPTDDAISASTSDARTAAEASIERVGLSMEGLSESAQLVRQAGVTAYKVEWKESGGTQTAKFDVWVNASTGSVFVFVDLRMQPNLAAPLVGRERAAALAITALGIPGETVTSAELAIDFTTGSQSSVWQVGFVSRTVRVDAVTGETTIVKS